MKIDMQLTIYRKPFHTLVFFFLLIVCGKANVKSQQIVPYSEYPKVISSNAQLSRAILTARESLPAFIANLEERCLEPHSHLITVLERNGDALYPVGILVDSFVDGRFRGSRVTNDLNGSIGPRLECTMEQVCDWRYVDTFLLIGGHFYRAVLADLPRAVRRDVCDEASFLLRLPNDVSNSDYELCRLIRANDNVAVETRIQEHTIDVYQDRLLLMQRQTKPDVASISFLSFTCMYGNVPVLEFMLSQNGQVPVDMLHDAARAGNYSVLSYLVGKSMDIDGLDESGRTPLHYAAQLFAPTCAECLLRAKALPNVRDRDKRTG